MNESTAISVAQSPLSRKVSYWRQYGMRISPILTLYAALAVYQIDDQSLWVDEVISVRAVLSGQSMSSLFVNSQCPLYFVLLRFWSNTVGTSEFGLRLFSAVLGAGAVCVTYVIGLRLLNRKSAAIAALFLATSPFFIWYSQEVRYITLIILTSLLATYCFHQAITTDRLGWWTSYTVFSVLAVFSFVSVVLLLLFHGLYVLWRVSDRSILRKWVACQLVTFLFFASWFVGVYGQRLTAAVTKAPAVISDEQRRSQETLPASDLAGAIPYTFFAFSVGFSLGPSVRELQISRSISTLLNHAAILMSVGILFATVFVFGLAQLSRNRGADTFLLLWLSVPLLGAFIVATMTTFHVYNIRYVAMALPAYILILATGIARVRQAPIQIALLSSVLLVNGISLANYYSNPRYARADARAAAQYLASEVRAGDTILGVGNLTALDYYSKGTLPIEGIDMGRPATDAVDRLQRIANSHERLWLVEIRPWETDPRAELKTLMSTLLFPPKHKEFAGVNIYTYDLAPNSSNGRDRVESQ